MNNLNHKTINEIQSFQEIELQKLLQYLNQYSTFYKNHFAKHTTIHPDQNDNDATDRLLLDEWIRINHPCVEILVKKVSPCKRVNGFSNRSFPELTRKPFPSRNFLMDLAITEKGEAIKAPIAKQAFIKCCLFIGCSFLEVNEATDANKTTLWRLYCKFLQNLSSGHWPQKNSPTARQGCTIDFSCDACLFLNAFKFRALDRLFRADLPLAEGIDVEI